MDLISDLNGIAESKVIKNVNLLIIYKRISLQKNELKLCCMRSFDTTENSKNYNSSRFLKYLLQTAYNNILNFVYVLFIYL